MIFFLFNNSKILNLLTIFHLEIYRWYLTSTNTHKPIELFVVYSNIVKDFLINFVYFPILSFGNTLILQYLFFLLYFLCFYNDQFPLFISFRYKFWNQNLLWLLYHYLIFLWFLNLLVFISIAIRQLILICIYIFI